jgi:cytosolic carboxypeptidase protein 6
VIVVIMRRRLLPVILLAAAAGCATAPVAEAPVTPGPDTEALPISATRPIHDTHRRTVGFLDAGVWISNELAGGRVSDVWQVDDSTFVVHNRPENAPINNSAWYAFKVWSERPQTIRLHMAYDDGRHRYWPKVRRAGEPWAPLDSAAVWPGSGPSEAWIRLDVGPDTVWVAGQPMLTAAFFDAWTDSLAALPHVSRSVIGHSARGRPIRMMQLGSDTASRHVLIISRQHPPEVTGTKALVAFTEEMAGSSDLAVRFRNAFRVHIVPLVNPDGVELGHWRHNTGGVDLNRDWVAFNQPETQVVRDAFLRETSAPGAAVWFAADFHSTNRDVFYTLEREFETVPPGVIDRWLDYIATSLPHYEVSDAPSGLGSPTSRNWFYQQYRTTALTYEVGDNTDAALIREVAATAARGMMQVLLDELRRLQ